MARSSVAAELRAMAHEACELIWVKMLVNERLGFSVNDPMNLYCDNKATLISLIIQRNMN